MPRIRFVALLGKWVNIDQLLILLPARFFHQNQVDAEDDLLDDQAAADHLERRSVQTKKIRATTIAELHDLIGFGGERQAAPPAPST